MMEKILKSEMLNAFTDFLSSEERSRATKEKYFHDVQYFCKFVGTSPLDKSAVLLYKKHLSERYEATSANSMLAALNSFLRFMGWSDLCVKQFKIQSAVFCPEEKELSRSEYFKLINEAEASGNERLSLIIQTICSSGIRVSELQYITADAVFKGAATVDCKGKNRLVFIVPELRSKLLRYMEKNAVTYGAVFVTRGGKPVNRCNIWREMKALCEKSGVLPSKVFPHNLRHLFARTFYGIENDIAKLADILGHSSIDTTRIYVTTTGSEHKEKMERLRLVP